ncbi:ATP synthase F1 subunit delta [Candidatus Falkowbacteria bacterium]|jgi:F-type H+-transporting ATPase subunit delta|nr:ATP synthase F1 subunit delta [Candidatus Falkowbacteria bacterium]MBT4433267.1 ATP synthase F1 subunit delta [Candidatus Falkowbacteria bacterium]
MKITSKQYALSLYDVTIDSDKGDLEMIIKNFIKVLVKNNDLKIVDKIIDEFNDILDKKEGRAKVEVISAYKLDNEVIELLNKNISKMLDKKEIIINNKVQKDILGGLILKYNDTVIDGSLKKKLALLKQDLSR